MVVQITEFGIANAALYLSKKRKKKARMPVPKKRGYRRFAAAMAWDPALMIFPRFRAANALNLLCLQAEITALEDELSSAIDRDDLGSDPEQKDYSRNFQTLREHGPDSRQYQLHMELRATLGEYNEVMIQQITLNDQISPTNANYEYLHKWLDHPHGGARDLHGAGSGNFLPHDQGGRVQNDLIMLAASSSRRDPFMPWAAAGVRAILRCIPCWRPKNRPFAPDEGETGFTLYGTSEQLQSAGDKFMAIFATLLILVPVIVLHFVKDPGYRLIIVVAFSMSFIIAMATLSGAKRSELVAASAAFVAVQVVYIGSVTTTK